jgi:hypothetical protein
MMDNDGEGGKSDEGRETKLFSEWIRRAIFWAWDFLTGSKVRKHYLDVKYIMENGINPDAAKKQDDYLYSIFRYATENV